jgi:hypothetical protein
VIDQRLGGRLRRLPGVLDCSVIDGGVALLVHPEVDIRVLKARAQAVMFELGDDRPLLLIGGLGSSPAAGDGRRSPFSLGAFVVAVLCLLALMPTAAPPRPRPPFSGPLAAASADSLTPELARPRMLSAAGRRSSAVRSPGPGAAVVVAGPDRSAGPDPVAAPRVDADRHAAGRRRAGAPRRPTAPLPPRPPAVPVAVDAISAVRLPQTSSVELFRGPGESGPHRHAPKP